MARTFQAAERLRQDVHAQTRRALGRGQGAVLGREGNSEGDAKHPQGPPPSHRPPRPAPSATRPGDFKPSHDGMPHCKSGSLASGGTKAHCTCDTCF